MSLIAFCKKQRASFESIDRGLFRLIFPILLLNILSRIPILADQFFAAQISATHLKTAAVTANFFLLFQILGQICAQPMVVLFHKATNLNGRIGVVSSTLAMIICSCCLLLGICSINLDTLLTSLALDLNTMNRTYSMITMVGAALGGIGLVLKWTLIARKKTQMLVISDFIIIVFTTLLKALAYNSSLASDERFFTLSALTACGFLTSIAVYTYLLKDLIRPSFQNLVDYLKRSFRLVLGEAAVATLFQGRPILITLILARSTVPGLTAAFNVGQTTASLFFMAFLSIAGGSTVWLSSLWGSDRSSKSLTNRVKSIRTITFWLLQLPLCLILLSSPMLLMSAFHLSDLGNQIVACTVLLTMLPISFTTHSWAVIRIFERPEALAVTTLIGHYLIGMPLLYYFAVVEGSVIKAAIFGILMPSLVREISLILFGRRLERHAVHNELAHDLAA